MEHHSGLPAPRVPGVPVRHHETSHTETWEITFKATVPAGLRAPGLQESAEEIIKLRMTEVLNAAGVADPQVRATKLGRSPLRGEWEGGVEYWEGEIVWWQTKTYVATKPSCNRPPHTHAAGFRQCWSEIEPVVVDALFAPPKELGRSAVVYTEGEVSRIVHEGGGTTVVGGTFIVEDTGDEDIVDAEIVDEP